MTSNTASEFSPAGWSNPFTKNMRVWPYRPGSPCYGDEPWDLAKVATRVSMGERFIRFANVPAQHRLVVKNVLMVLACPDQDAVVDAGVVRRGRGGQPSALYDCFLRLVLITKWSTGQGIARIADWKQADADRFVEDLRAGLHRKDGVGIGATAVRSYVTALRLLRECSEVLPDAFTFFPWPGQTAADVAGEIRHTENTTPPLPWESWAPLVAASWLIVDQFSSDVIAAVNIRAALPKVPRGPSGNNAYQVLLDWAQQRGPMPLHTGFGRTKHSRGTPNSALLHRMLGLNDSALTRARHRYKADTMALIAEAAADPARAKFGGLHIPTAAVSHMDGTTSAWIDELGLGETEHLESVLRAACYVLIASLTGMRDSEIQELTRNTSTTRDGLAALRSIQHKGNDNPDGQGREWWAPHPVIRTIEVLADLARHRTHLFARSSDNIGTYDPSRDVSRLIAFVNDDPAQRVGRGRGLGLEPIQTPKGHAINATSLRRSFCVFATTHPGAELGLGIQLGHSAWRMTTGYISDGQQQAVRLMDDERKRVLHRDATTLLQQHSPVAGAAGQHITQFRAQIIAEPARLDRLAATLAERLHLGLTNDCVWNPATSGCGSDRPKLGDHVCIGIDCTNALLRPAHIGVLSIAIERIDTYLDQQQGHPALIQQMRRDRTYLAGIRRELTTAADPQDIPEHQLHQEDDDA